MYLKDKETVENMDELKEQSYAGKTVSEEEVKAFVIEFIDKNGDLIKECELKINHPTVFNKMKDENPLADPSLLLKFANPIVKEKFKGFKVEKKVKKPKYEKVETKESKE